MTWLRAIIIFGTIAAILLKMTNLSEACNEAICSNIVSKCMLNKKCICKMETCSCCKECSICLNDLYDECCSCFDLCPKPKATEIQLNRSSQIEEFEKPIPGLFASLTSEPDPQERWTSFTYPVKINYQLFHFSQTMKQESDQTKYFVETVDKDVQNPVKPERKTQNCTVAFISKCISSNKCKSSCLSMGATSFRWFHNGCCECVGHICINYGLNEARCSKCPDLENMEEDDTNYDDYGQYDDDYEEY